MQEIMRRAAEAAASVNAQLGVSNAGALATFDEAKAKATAALERLNQELVLHRDQERVSITMAPNLFLHSSARCQLTFSSSSQGRREAPWR